MKNLFFSVMFAAAAFIVICGCGSDNKKTSSTEDSIKKADSIVKVILGTYKQEGENTYMQIVKSGDLFTVTENNVTYAYKLEGQLLTSVDGTGPTYSLIGNGELLKGSTKYTKTDVITADTEAKDESSESTSDKKATETKSKKKTKTTPTTNASASATSTSTAPTELTIVSENTINLFQSPRAGAAIVKGLSNGTVCTVISKGSQLTTFGGKTDYWYNVKVEGFKGWVFGGFTSLKQP